MGWIYSFYNIPIQLPLIRASLKTKLYPYNPKSSLCSNRTEKYSSQTYIYVVKRVRHCDYCAPTLKFVPIMWVVLLARKGVHFETHKRSSVQLSIIRIVKELWKIFFILNAYYLLAHTRWQCYYCAQITLSNLTESKLYNFILETQQKIWWMVALVWFIRPTNYMESITSIYTFMKCLLCVPSHAW